LRRRLGEQQPKAEIVEMREGLHHLFIHRREETAAAIRAFLKKVFGS
jgi:hypothetical protein